RPKRVDQVLGGCRREADQVDDCVRTNVGDPSTEDAGDLVGGAVGVYVLYRPPLRGLLVRLPFAATDRDDLMAGAQQSGHEVGADVPRRPDPHDPPHAQQATALSRACPLETGGPVPLPTGE